MKFRERASATVLACLLLAACAREVLEVEYDSFTVARDAGAMQRGWLPAWLPPNATRIRERHDLDTNARMWIANVPIGIDVSLPRDCESIKPESAPSPPFELDWWPAGIPRKMNAAGSYYLFRCDGQFVGLAASGGKLVGWTVR